MSYELNVIFIPQEQHEFISLSYFIFHLSYSHDFWKCILLQAISNYLSGVKIYLSNPVANWATGPQNLGAKWENKEPKKWPVQIEPFYLIFIINSSYLA